MVAARAGALWISSPDKVLGLLAGATLAPLAADIGPGGQGVAAVIAAVLGGVGGNLVSEKVSAALDKARRKRDGEADEEAASDAIAKELTEALARNDEAARQLSGQIIDVVQGFGGFEAAMSAATGGLRDHLATTFAELARGNQRVLEVLERVERRQRHLSDGVDEAVDRLRLLSRPAAPVQSPGPQVAPVFVAVSGAAAAGAGEVSLEERWRAGEEGWLGDRRYLLLGEADGLLREDRDPSGQHVRRQALARQTVPAPAAGRAYAWLRQGDPGLTQERDLLRRAHVMSQRAAGLPEIVHLDGAGRRVVLALSWPADRDGLPCQTLRASFAPGSLDDWRVSLLLSGLRGLTYPLGLLHRLGIAHRNLAPEAIIVTGNGRLVLRDLGLAAVGFRPGEGPAGYQAPEQAFGARRTGTARTQAGAAADVYQLAAIAYHLITGRLPVVTGYLPPPSHPALPGAVADIIAAALAAEPAGRPGLHEFRMALKVRQR
jgi:hypothetical protein